MLCFSVCLCRGVFKLIQISYLAVNIGLIKNRFSWTDYVVYPFFSHSFIAPQKRFLRTFLLNTRSISPPFLMGGQLSVPNFEKGGGGGSKKKSAWEGDLKSSCHGYLSGWAYYVSSQKKTFKNKIWVWGLNFKWWSWPVLPKQPINV